MSNALRKAATVEQTDQEHLQTFIDNFAVLCEATGGVGSVRKLVLELAIRGFLSVRLKNDGSARQLFDAAHADRVDRQHRGQARQMDELAEPGADEAPFGLPSSWIWTRIGLAVNLVNGRAFKPSDWSTTGLPIIRIQNLNNPNAPYNYCGFEVEPKHLLKSGDFLISWSGTPGTSFGAFIWDGPKGVLNQHIFRAEIYGDAYEKRFLRIAINARLDEMIAQAHGAVGLQHITKGRLEALAIPLPPLAEQRRIVARVDELMRLLDDFEAKQNKTREAQARLRTAALGALTSAEGPEGFATAWQRIIENFGVLFEKAESVTGIRTIVRDLAVCGLLVPQLRSEGSGQDLLPVLQADVESAGQDWTVPSTDDLLQRTPASWASVRLAHLTTFGPRNGYSPKAVDRATNTKSLTLTATTSGRFNGDHSKYIDEVIPANSYLWLEDGDVLIQRANTIDYVGMAAVYRGPRHTFIYPDLMMKLRLSAAVDVDYIHLVLVSTQARAFMQSRATGTAGSMPKINQTVVASIPVPLPPLGEQKRIVAKVEQLMKLCDELEAKLRESETTAAKLVDAVVSAMIA